MAGIGSESKSKREQEEQQSQNGKHCIVRFRPVDGWNGDYGFDWFRAAGDYEDKISQSENTANYESCIGKYMGMTGSARIYYNWEGKPNCIENTPIEPNCNIETDPAQVTPHFCQYYLKRDGMIIPVEKDGDKYTAWHYCDETDSPWQEIKFSNFYARTKFKIMFFNGEFSALYCSYYGSEETEDPETRKTVRTYGWSPEEEFHTRKEFSSDAMDKYAIDRQVADRIFKSGNDRITAEYLKSKGFRAESRYAVTKKVTVWLGGKRYYFEYQNGILEVFKFYNFKKEIEKLEFDQLIDKYNTARDNRTKNDAIAELTKHFYPYFILGRVDKKNWDPGIAKREGDQQFDRDIRKEKEEAEVHAVTHTGNKTIKSLHEKGKIKFPKMFLNSSQVDEYTLRNTGTINDRPSAFFIEIAPVINVKDESLTVSKVDKKYPLYSAMFDNELLKISEKSDDGVLHPYWEKYFPSEVDTVYDHSAGKVKLYPPCTLGLSQFGSKKEHRRFGKLIYDEADVQVKVQGDFDKITFTSSNPEHLKVSPESISNPSKNKLNIKVTGVCRDYEYITARNENGKKVGFLEVRVWPPIPLRIMIVTVKFTGDKIELPDEDYNKQMNKEGGWTSDKDQHHQLLAQAGIIPYETKISFNIPESEILPYCNEDKTIVRYNDVKNISIGERIDKLFVNKLHGSDRFLRVYVLNSRCLVNGWHIYGASFNTAGQDVVLMFKKTFDEQGSGMNETLGHELLHQLGLCHTFDNNSPVTFMREKTSNVMDYSDRTMSLCRVQWDVMRNVAQRNWTKWGQK